MSSRALGGLGALLLPALLFVIPAASANHLPGSPCGGSGDDFIYGSHGRNTIYGGKGNDAISVHYGRGVVDCGPGRDIYHVARSIKKSYRFVHCEKVDYRSERQRGGGLRPLP
jgi:Ca2+-binding RTX toxin-like protein